MQHHSGLLETAQRSQHHGLRSHHETLLQLAEHLKPEDRLLLENRFGRGMSNSELALMMRLHPSTVRSRINTLIKLVGSNEFRFLAAYRERLPKELRIVAEAVVFKRKTMREVGEMTGQTLHETRKSLERFRALTTL